MFSNLSYRTRKYFAFFLSQSGQ